MQFVSIVSVLCFLIFIFLGPSFESYVRSKMCFLNLVLFFLPAQGAAQRARSYDGHHGSGDPQPPDRRHARIRTDLSRCIHWWYPVKVTKRNETTF